MLLQALVSVPGVTTLLDIVASVMLRVPRGVGALPLTALALAASFVVSWAVAQVRAVAFTARWIAAAWIAAVLLLYVIGFSHRTPPEALLPAVVVYPILACEAGRARGVRVWLLTSLSACATGELWDYFDWRYALPGGDLPAQLIGLGLFAGAPPRDS